MKKKELIETLIKHYTECIKTTKELRNIPQIHKFLKKKQVSSGICNCMFFYFHTSFRLLSSKWIEKYYVGGFNIWGNFPREFTTKKEILAALQIRLDNLRTELKFCK